MVCTFIDHRNDVKMFKAQVEPRAASKWYLHRKVSSTHFDVISMADKNRPWCKERFSMNSLFASNFIYSFPIFALTLFLVIRTEFV